MWKCVYINTTEMKTLISQKQVLKVRNAKTDRLLSYLACTDKDMTKSGRGKNRKDDDTERPSIVSGVTASTYFTRDVHKVHGQP
jgi:hypothetical protein